MNYYFVEIKDGKIITFHDSTDMEIVYKNSSGLLIEVTEQEYNLLKACRGDVSKGIRLLHMVQGRIVGKILEND